MKLSVFNQLLNQVEELNFVLPNGNKMPQHFHVTEVGQVTKHFIDCGGTIRNEGCVNFQLWQAGDVDHRLAPQKLKNIIALSEIKLGLVDGEIEIEYQDGTIGKYALEFDGQNFVLTTKFTNCLANDKCGIPDEKLKMNLVELATPDKSCCIPGGSCC